LLGNKTSHVFDADNFGVINDVLGRNHETGK